MDYNSLNIDDKIKVLTEDADLSNESLLNKIDRSNQLMDNDPQLVIITDFKNDLNPDYTLNDLNQKYSDYMNLSPDYRRICDGYSLSIWHLTVHQMYNRMKSKLRKNKDIIAAADLNPSVIDKVLYQYNEEIKEAVYNYDYLTYQKLKIDSIINHNNLYISAVTESVIDTNPYPKKYDYSADIPNVVPFMTYDEYIDKNNIEDIPMPIDYIMINDEKKYYDIIHDLQNMIGTDKESIAIEQLLKLGWNPMVKITAESLKYARDKQIKWMNEHEQINIIDFSNYNTNCEALSEVNLFESYFLKPIYIILSYTETTFGKIITKWTKSHYSHAGISSDALLNKIYSYDILPNRKENGFVIESLDDYNDKNGNADIAVLCIFVPDEVKRKFEENLNYFVANKNKTKYSIRNVFNIAFNKVRDYGNSLKLVCSQFVDTILKMSNINITNKSSNLVIPEDFMKSANDKNVFLLFHGKKSEYDFRNIEKKVTAILKNLSIDNLNTVKSNNVLNTVNQNLIENFNIDCSDNTEISKILREMRNYVKPNPVIVLNEIKIPIGFNKKGSLYITAPKDLQAEYEEAHKLLYSYNETNLQGIKHELARLFYLNSIIEKKLKKLDKNDSKRKEYIDLRARILNDFYTYIKLVTSIEKEFDFMEYIKSTDYYNKIIEIDDSTLKYSGAYIKKAIKSILKKKPD